MGINAYLNGEKNRHPQSALSLETLNLIDSGMVILAFGSPEIQDASVSSLHWGLA